MNLGIPISYIIAGILILMIAGVSINTSRSSNELSLQETQKRKVSDVIEVITYDIPKIGYNLNSRPDTLIKAAGDNYIEFYANIDNSADQSLELIRWELTSTAITETENPNDYELIRTVNGVSQNLNAGIVGFSLRYFSSLGSNSPLSTPISAVSQKSIIDSINQIEIVLETESAIKLESKAGNDERYVKTSWTKRFSPVNLRDN